MSYLYQKRDEWTSRNFPAKVKTVQLNVKHVPLSIYNFTQKEKTTNLNFSSPNIGREQLCICLFIRKIYGTAIPKDTAMHICKSVL